MRRGWTHHGFAPLECASPVEVLSLGPKRAKVRLIHRLRWNRKWFQKGSVRYVPSDCIGVNPNFRALIGVGRGMFVAQAEHEARAIMKRWEAKP